MRFAILVKIDGEEYALLKTDNSERIEALAGLCRHIEAVFPGQDAECFASTDRSTNVHVGMHPDRIWIIDKLRALEHPLPDEIIIEGDYVKG